MYKLWHIDKKIVVGNVANFSEVDINSLQVSSNIGLTSRARNNFFRSSVKVYFWKIDPIWKENK